METIVDRQHFNVLCVTKRSDDRGVGTARFHLPIRGEAEMLTVVEEPYPGVKITKMWVTFQGMIYDLDYLRSGLNGNAVLLAVKVKYDPGFSIWELYTDTPTGPDVTPEMLRKMAENQINR
jgi:hypothetical protein